MVMLWQYSITISLHCYVSLSSLGVNTLIRELILYEIRLVWRITQKAIGMPTDAILEWQRSQWIPPSIAGAAAAVMVLIATTKTTVIAIYQQWVKQWVLYYTQVIEHYWISQQYRSWLLM